MSQLSNRDRNLVALALVAGRALEADFNEIQAAKFSEALSNCGAADSDLVKKLEPLSPKVSLALGPKHLMALLVPIERLSGRTARDEEFLFFERDQTKPSAKKETEPTDGLANKKLIVICENIRSAFNVGAVFRTTEAFGANDVWLAGYTPEPQKTAMGTDAVINFERFDRARDAIDQARKQGAIIVGLETSHHATPMDQFEWPETTALVLGNERFGLDSDTLAACDHIVRIKTSGTKNSLNVGIAFGIAASKWSESVSKQRKTTSTSTAPSTRPSGSPSTSSVSTISVIGHLRGGFQNSQVAPRQGAYSNARATIELVSRFENEPSNFDQALKDLDGFERAWILFEFHESLGWKAQVRPPRGDGTKRGLFSTRSPHRPSKLGLSCVRIFGVDTSKRTIDIGEHDLLDGTPIFDIKPYIPEADAFPDAKAGWIDHIECASHSISEHPEATRKLNWLETSGENRLRSFIHEQLRFQPLDDERKRINIVGSGTTKKIGTHHTISFRTWRIDFRLQPQAIEILDVRSGYNLSELLFADFQDKVGDANLHRRFNDEF